MKRLLPLALLPFLAACDPASQGSGLNAIFPGLAPQPEEPAGPVYPPQVIAALPEGASPSIILQTPDGCYLFSIERTDPPSGFPVRDSSGQPICDPPGGV